MDHNNLDASFFGWTTLLGVLIGLGQVLDSTEKLSWRIIVGRAMVSAGLASMAPIILIWFPKMPFTAELAIAALMASLGTSGLQMIVNRIVAGRSR